MTTWLTLVGMGEDGVKGLGFAARAAIAEAALVVGSSRLLALLPDTTTRREAWPLPLGDVAAHMARFRGQKTVILATGDPLNYGIGRAILSCVPIEEVTILPHLSAFCLAAARLGWHLPECETLSLHGRPASLLEPFIQPQARLLILTSDGATPAEIARRLCARGFGSSALHILEAMGGAQENRLDCTAETLADRPIAPLNLVAVECRAGPGARFLPRMPGLPDEAFEHDGQLTKREVRAATLAALAPWPGAHLWDVGAGCGSIAIEWMRAARGCTAIAFEQDATRLSFIARNAQSLGTPGLEIVAGAVPETLGGHTGPDAVFIGGALRVPGVFEACWAALKPGGGMVANVVTIEGELHLYDLHEKYGGDLVRMDISVLTRVGRLRALKPRMSVMQWRVTKP